MNKTAICYFSGTGNGLDLAQQINQQIEDSDIFYIPSIDMDALMTYKKIVLVTPVYLFGIPNIVKSFIQALGAVDSANVSYYVVLHYGGFAGNAAHYTKIRFQQSGLDVQAIYKIKMPENFTFYMSVPKFYSRRILKASTSKIVKIADKIRRGDKKNINKTIFAFSDGIHEKGQQKWYELPKDYVVSDACTRCGLCVDICPTHNIELNETISFKDNCVACLACYHRCPQQAINYRDKTINKPRYCNPNVDMAMMK